MALCDVWILLALGIGLVEGGVITRTINACQMCPVEGDLIRCTMDAGRVEVTVDVTECPGVKLLVGHDSLVTGFIGYASEVFLARTTLGCGDVKAKKAVLNNEKCEYNPQHSDPSTTTSSTTTTTMKYPFPVRFPVPVPEPDEDIDEHMTTSTAGSTTLTITASQDSTTVTVATTTMMIAVTLGAQFNGTMIIATVAVALTAVGLFITVRIVKRRLQERRNLPRPVQVAEVSSTSSGYVRENLRRRSGSRESFESMELFPVKTD